MSESQLADEMLAQYRAAQSGVAWRDLSERAKLRAGGPDRVDFLHAVLSNEVRALPDFAGRYGALLTATGKIVADFDYYRFPEFFLIDVARELSERLRATLEGYIIMDDVILEDLSARFRHFAFEGETAPELLLELLGGPLPETPRRIVPILWEGAEIWLLRKDQLSDSGFEVIVPSDQASGFRERMKEKGRACGLVEIGVEAFDILRLERGIPLNGVDFSDRNNPIEIGLSDAYSLTKGCYPGQEVMAKATNIGGVARLLVRMRLAGRSVPEAGAKVYSQDGREIGRITSSGFSPRLDQTVALALVKRAKASVGMKHRVEVGREDRIEGEIVEKFL